MKPLTERQQQTLDFIRSHVRQAGTIPSRKEIAAALGVTHKSAVNVHLSALMAKGWIELNPGRHRSIRLLHEELPVTTEGTIAAGEPILAEGRVTRRVPRSVAEQFSPQPDYFLTVRGDSMNRLGLTNGTIVAIKREPEPQNNAIVVARIGDEVTLKRFVRTAPRTVELRPESTNPEHEPIVVDLATTDLEVDGVAVGALIAEGFDSAHDTH